MSELALGAISALAYVLERATKFCFVQIRSVLLKWGSLLVRVITVRRRSWTT
eukprot:CAMPEP_0196668238 /NCGR_PEP_ID=MMETSP1086-20130531/65514_1 /TAXON_ID=77921 /ORGANISM="Cyanoptyche  gloeocystis , Strain SAG4.97" /LENGTH=51 /DNA_ID=CAMNT_0042005629 /DNA_START=753 /DNA_END=908 /DNA_ORIENTATION=-